MRLDSFLTKQLRLLKRGKAAQAAEKLQNEVVRYHGSPTFYSILGQACLRSGDLKGAQTYFQQALEKQPHDGCLLLALAFFHLRRGDTKGAIEFYLEIQDLPLTQAKKNVKRRAQRAMRIIRKAAAQGSGNDALLLWMNSKKAKQLYPPLPFVRPSAATIAGLALLVVLALGGCGVFYLHSQGYNLKAVREAVFPAKAERSGYATSALLGNERKAPVSVDGSFRYVLTQSQVLSLYTQARQLFNDYKDQECHVAVNKILNSNASDAVKAKAKLLLSYMPVPGFDTFKENQSFSYKDVAKDPLSYRDCYVIWRGRAANINDGTDKPSFNLLVGYDNGKTLDGIVPVTMDFVTSVTSDAPIRVLGKVSAAKSKDGTVTLSLEGTALYQGPQLR
jgi:tetratricopeptide (TPR) repeat protein